MHNPTVSICYIKRENILLFFLLSPIPFPKVQEELTQESEETSFASLKRRHSLETMCTASPTQSDQVLLLQRDADTSFSSPHPFPGKQFPISLATAVSVPPHILPYLCLIFTDHSCMSKTYLSLPPLLT